MLQEDGFDFNVRVMLAGLYNLYKNEQTEETFDDWCYSRFHLLGMFLYEYLGDVYGDMDDCATEVGLK